MENQILQQAILPHELYQLLYLPIYMKYIHVIVYHNTYDDTFKSFKTEVIQSTSHHPQYVGNRS